MGGFTRRDFRWVVLRVWVNGWVIDWEVLANEALVWRGSGGVRMRLVGSNVLEGVKEGEGYLGFYTLKY